MENNVPSMNSIQKSVWEGKLPLEIVLAPSESRVYDQTDPYLVCFPRVSYLFSLLPKLSDFFTSFLIEPTSRPHDGWFSFEGVPLKWHYPIGLLYDLYAGADPASKTSPGKERDSSLLLPRKQRRSANTDSDSESERGDSSLPWRLTVHFNDWPEQDLVRLDDHGIVIHDAFINSVKEADFLRNGTAKGIMSLSKEDSSGLWKAVEQADLSSFQRISKILLPPPSQPFRNIPIRVFLPLPPDSNSPSFKVVQSPLPPFISTSGQLASSAVGSSTISTQPQTVGTALHALLPHLFPSRRIPVLAKPVLHGAVLPMSAPIEEVARSSAYGDGWVYIVVRMMG